MSDEPDLDATTQLDIVNSAEHDLYLCSDEQVARVIVRRASTAFSERFAEIVRQNMARHKLASDGD
jgi:hypothetical protein